MSNAISFFIIMKQESRNEPLAAYYVNHEMILENDKRKNSFVECFEYFMLNWMIFAVSL